MFGPIRFEPGDVSLAPRAGRGRVARARGDLLAVRGARHPATLDRFAR